MTQDFNGFGLPDKLLQSLERLKFTTPTPIQAQAIPLGLEGRDILGSAQTGTGKTGAFGIPLLTRLLNHPREGALVLTPTRELACQVMNALQQMIPVKEIRTAILIGGEPINLQLRQLASSPRLIVATPGRLNDHLERGSVKLNNMHTLVLDETDRMLDMGFGPQLERIVRFLPKERQTMMFSATMPAQIEKLSAAYLNDPVRLSVGSLNAPITKINQEVIHTTDGEKYDKLMIQLNKREGSVIIFVKTKHGTERLADKLNRADMRADAIHGDLQQRKRERVLRSFRKQEYRILVATDVAARGLDIPHIAHVINYDMPQCPEDYIHRIGRTGRAGAEGQALNLLTPADTGKWKAIHRLMNGEDPGPSGPSQRRSGPQRNGGGGRRFEGGRGGSDHRGSSGSSWRPRGEDRPSQGGSDRRESSWRPRGEGAPAQGGSDRRESSWRPRGDGAPAQGGSDRRESSWRPRGEDRPSQGGSDRRESSWRPRGDDRPAQGGSDRRESSWRPRGEGAPAQGASFKSRGPSSWHARNADATPESGERRGPYKERAPKDDSQGFKKREGGSSERSFDAGANATQKRAPSKWGPKSAPAGGDRSKSYPPKRPRAA